MNDGKPAQSRAEEFIQHIVKLINTEHEKPRYKMLRLMVELDERGKLPKVTVRAVPPGVTLRKDEKKAVTL